MTQAELFQALKSIGLPVAYREFKEGPNNPLPNPPYLVYLFSYANDMMADNQNYLPIDNFQIELYTNLKHPPTEQLVQNKLRELELPYSKTETYIDSEELFQIIYEIQLIGG